MLELTKTGKIPAKAISAGASLVHLEENMAAEELQLSQAEWKKIEELV